MNAFEYVNAPNLEKLPSLLGKERGETQVIAGGTDLLGELKERTISPKRLVNLKSIPNLSFIKETKSGLSLGALTTITEIAENQVIQKRFTALAQAAAAVSSPQIRNMGTLGGNLCQRPRCWYYRDAYYVCFKKGGNKCYAVEGENKYHAIFATELCPIVHPSDIAPALIALNAKVTILGPDGSKQLPLAQFFTLPSVDVTTETILKPNEVVTEVEIPTPSSNTKSVFLKLKERDSSDFALASVACAIVAEGGICKEARVVLGGVAPIPWRSSEAEEALKGKKISEDLAKAAADTALQKARPLRQTFYKVSLSKALVKRAIMAIA